jgi:hypothetical protein
MANKITFAELSGMFARYCTAVQMSGIDSSNYRLRMGDEAHTYSALDDGAGTIGTGSYGYLGDTKREAYRALLVMAQALEDVRENNRKAVNV